MDQMWNTYQLFSLLTVGFWYEGTAAGCDMDELYASLTKRLRLNLLGRMLR